MDISLKATEAFLRNETKSVAEHEEVCRVETAVKPVRPLKKRHVDRHLAEEADLGHGESREKFAVACRGMTCLAIPARFTGHCYRQDKDKSVPKTQEG
jgi:hypothetical protein